MKHQAEPPTEPSSVPSAGHSSSTPAPTENTSNTVQRKESKILPVLSTPDTVPNAAPVSPRVIASPRTITPVHPPPTDAPPPLAPGDAPPPPPTSQKPTHTTSTVPPVTTTPAPTPVPAETPAPTSAPAESPVTTPAPALSPVSASTGAPPPPPPPPMLSDTAPLPSENAPPKPKLKLKTKGVESPGTSIFDDIRKGKALNKVDPSQINLKAATDAEVKDLAGLLKKAMDVRRFNLLIQEKEKEEQHDSVWEDE